MNGQAAKASRRALRRTIAATGVSLIDKQGEAIHDLGTALNRHRANSHERFEALSVSLSAQDAQIAAFDALASRGFWGRLSWLVRGR